MRLDGPAMAQVGRQRRCPRCDSRDRVAFILLHSVQKHFVFRAGLFCSSRGKVEWYTGLEMLAWMGRQVGAQVDGSSGPRDPLAGSSHSLHQAASFIDIGGQQLVFREVVLLPHPD